MTNQEAKDTLTQLEDVIKKLRTAVLSDAGYVTVGECERLTIAMRQLSEVIETNVLKNMPF